MRPGTGRTILPGIPIGPGTTPRCGWRSRVHTRRASGSAGPGAVRAVARTGGATALAAAMASAPARHAGAADARHGPAGRRVRQDDGHDGPGLRAAMPERHGGPAVPDARAEPAPRSSMSAAARERAIAPGHHRRRFGPMDGDPACESAGQGFASSRDPRGPAGATIASTLRHRRLRRRSAGPRTGRRLPPRRPLTGLAVGDGCDDALAGTIIGRIEAEVVHDPVPRKTADAPAREALGRVDRRRRLGPIGHTPPAEAC